MLLDLNLDCDNPVKGDLQGVTFRTYSCDVDCQGLASGGCPSGCASALVVICVVELGYRFEEVDRSA